MLHIKLKGHKFAAGFILNLNIQERSECHESIRNR
jgi:hypothetical protein